MSTRNGSGRASAAGIDWADVLRQVRDDGVLFRHARLAAAAAHAPLAFVRLDDGSDNRVSAIARDPREPVGDDPSVLDDLVDRVVATGEWAAVHNAREAEHVLESDSVSDDGTIGTVAAVPIRLRGRAVRGAVAVGACGARSWTDRDLVFLDDVASALAQAVEQRVRGDGLERRAADLDARLRHARTSEDVARLAGGIAHDFNNLMLTMSSYTQLLLETPDLDDECRHDLLEVEKAVERATALAGRLLNLSRQQGPELELLDVSAVVEGMQKMLGRLVGRDIMVQTSLATELDQVRADPGQLERIILNLVVNARDAMPEGGILTIRTAEQEVDDAGARRLGLDRVGRYVMLAIEDTGEGIDEAIRTRIFEPFFTTKPQGSGTGIGLATVDAIARQADGAVEVLSTPGEGSSFRIYLPSADTDIESSGESVVDEQEAYQAAGAAPCDAAVPAPTSRPEA